VRARASYYGKYQLQVYVPQIHPGFGSGFRAGWTCLSSGIHSGYTTDVTPSPKRSVAWWCRPTSHHCTNFRSPVRVKCCNRRNRKGVAWRRCFVIPGSVRVAIKLRKVSAGVANNTFVQTNTDHPFAHDQLALSPAIPLQHTALSQP
jgi:hypothetical protein